ncbi:MAG: peptide chain release factor N(5)-glutamine methyltransferase, partial [Muribaculaceae bacterium]|nr:peptide chain release factor N(5)-glutamine methyltransferase [Muribaculaceae bacterium]
MTVTELNRHIIAVLTPVLGQGEAKSAARIIWDDVLHYTPGQIIIRGDHELEPFSVEHINRLLREVCGGRPLQYAIGTARFMGMDLKVAPDTLIPRPETAGLVDIITDDAGEQTDLHVLDIGTGSGCIAIALARALKFARIDAIDISAPALEVASENARNLGCRINFIHADALALPQNQAVDDRYDIIVS